MEKIKFFSIIGISGKFKYSIVKEAEFMKKIKIYTDGACSGNPGPGGWAALLIFNSHQKEISGTEENTTNNKMELKAALEALSILKEPCIVDLYTDSSYVREGMSKWIFNWKKNNWDVAIKKKIKNLELWQALDKIQQKHRITWHWVKGHAGLPENEHVDALARNALKSIFS